MAQTLIQRAPGVILNPRPNHPKVPDITSDLFVDLDARNLSVSNGAEITSMVAEGSGSARDRTFDVKRSDFGWPTFASNLGGLPAIRFDGTEMISNGGTGSGFPDQRTGPMTIGVVARINAYPTTGGHPQRIVTGARSEASSQWNSIQPATTAAGETPRVAAIEWDSNAGGNAAGSDFGYFTPTNPLNFFVGVVVFDGPRSKAKFFGGVEEMPQWLSAPYQGLSFGIRQTVSNPAGGAANFDLRKYVHFTRAFTSDEVAALHATLKEDFGVAQ